MTPEREALVGLRLVEVPGMREDIVLVRSVDVLLVANTDERTLDAAAEFIQSRKVAKIDAPETSTGDMTLLLDALGVTVVEVPGLKDHVCYVRDQRVGLIREGMPDTQRVAALEWLFGDACMAESEE